MLDDIAYLWKHRERPSKLRRWFVVMAKRLFLFFALVNLLIRPVLFRIKGAQIGRLVVLGKANIQGDLYNLTVDDQTSLGRCEIALHDKVKIGRRVVINDGAVLLTASHSLSDPQWR
ncbi:MAG: acyltransferase, partial [Cytophaga sp.]|nr:acyltransferase [Undibacterium sp.]